MKTDYMYLYGTDKVVKDIVMSLLLFFFYLFMQQRPTAFYCLIQDALWSFATVFSSYMTLTCFSLTLSGPNTMHWITLAINMRMQHAVFTITCGNMTASLIKERKSQINPCGF